MGVYIDRNDEVYITDEPKPLCKSCKTELWGGEITEGNGYCDTCR